MSEVATKRDWLRAFEVIAIHCPCCDADMTSLYSRGHEHDCKLMQFEARMSLWSKAPR